MTVVRLERLAQEGRAPVGTVGALDLGGGRVVEPSEYLAEVLVQGLYETCGLLVARTEPGSGQEFDLDALLAALEAAR